LDEMEQKKANVESAAFEGMIKDEVERCGKKRCGSYWEWPG